ncbi:4Fe-4S dicluster domain-containing protein [Gemmatimonadota bacterium]
MAGEAAVQIDAFKCVACANCVAVCPMGAITIDPAINRAVIDYDECVECSVCYRGMSQEHLPPTLVRMVRSLSKLFRFRFDPEPDVCPTAAFVMEELTWPRIVRRVFSDPVVEHESTGIHGRGTEEVKTNDVADRVKVGEVGYVIEMGRPGVGVRFKQIQAMTLELARLGVVFEVKNPITQLMTDTGRGTLRDDLLDEKILSAIVETKTSVQEVEAVLDGVLKVADQIDTVVSVGVSTRCSEDGGDNVLAPILTKRGNQLDRAKTNMGLGRITNRSL